MKLAARLALLALAAAFLRGDVVTTSQANVASNTNGGQFPGQEATELNVEAPKMCAMEPCMTMNCCCWSTLYQEEHPDYPNPEVANRERKCTRGDLPQEYVLVKEPGYVGTDGQYEAQMANQNPDFGVGRDLCCVASKDDVITQASRQSMQEEVPIEETTPPPLLENPDPTPTAEEVVEAPVESHAGNLTVSNTTPALHNSTGFHGGNHTNTSNHSNASWAVFAYARRASTNDGDHESEFDRLEQESDGGFDFRDLPRLQAEASAVMASRGHLRSAR
jgi:hypothetical protein